MQRADVADDQGAEGTLTRLYLPGGVERLHRVVGGEEEETVAGGDVEARGVLVEVIDGVVGATAGAGKGILAEQDERVALQLAADDAHVARAHPEGRAVVGLGGGVGRLVAQDLVDAVEGGEPAARRPLVGIVGIDYAVLRADIEKVGQRRVGGDGGQRLVEEQLVGVEGRRILAVAGHDRDQGGGGRHRARSRARRWMLLLIGVVVKIKSMVVVATSSSLGRWLLLAVGLQEALDVLLLAYDPQHVAQGEAVVGRDDGEVFLALVESHHHAVVPVP